MLNSWKKIPDHARPKTYLPDGSGPEKLFTEDRARAERATGWYEFLDGEFYYALRVSAGFVLLESPTRKRETLWQFAIEKGSGEPNFNEGNQYGTALKIVF